MKLPLKSALFAGLALLVKGMVIILVQTKPPPSAQGLAQTAHLSDGTALLVLVRRCGTLGLLRFLAAIPNTGNARRPFSIACLLLLLRGLIMRSLCYIKRRMPLSKAARCWWAPVTF